MSSESANAKAAKNDKFAAAAVAAAQAAQLDAENQHRINMSVATFANIELQSTQSTMRQYMQLYETAKNENLRLEDLLKERDRDSLQVVEYLRGELERKNVALRECELRLERCREDFDKDHAESMRSMKADITTRDEMITELRQQLAETRAKLAELSAFEVERQHLNLTVTRLKEAERDLVLSHEKEMTKIKFASLEEKVKLRAIEKAMNDRFEKEVDERAMQLVDQKAQQIREANIALITQKSQLEREVQRLTNQVRSTQEAMDAAQREANLARESHAEYARQGSKLTRIARESTKTARDLEVKCADLARTFEAQRTEMEANQAKKIVTLQEELGHSRRTAEQLRDSLQEMKRLTQTVLDQRSDLEAFFHEAIEYTRNRQLVEQPVSNGTLLGSTASSTRNTPAARNLAVVMAPRLAAGFRGDLDGRESVVKSEAFGAAVTARTSRGFTGALEPRGRGTFLTESDKLEPPPQSLTPRGRHLPGQHTGLSGSRPATRERQSALPVLTPNNATARISATRPSGATESEPQTPTATATTTNGTAARFGSLTWADKERVISALLMELNRTFYQAKEAAIPRLADRSQSPPQEEDAIDEGDWARPASMATQGAAQQAPNAALPPRGDSASVAFPSSYVPRPPQPPARLPDSRPPTGGRQPGPDSAIPPPLLPTGVLSALRTSKPGSAASARSSAGSQRKATFANDLFGPGTPAAAVVTTPSDAAMPATPIAATDPSVE